MTTNFKQKEFACKCGCGLDSISPTVTLIWQMVRSKFNTSVNITSGCRCVRHNKKVGGVKNSTHLRLAEDGLTHAADGQIDVPLQEVYDYIDNIFPTSLGIGIYNTFIHIDDRMDRAYRWDKRTGA